MQADISPMVESIGDHFSRRELNVIEDRLLEERNVAGEESN